MGSLFGILDKRIAALKEAQEDRVGTSLRIPGGVLGYTMSYRIALQVSCATCDVCNQLYFVGRLSSEIPSQPADHLSGPQV